MSRLLPIAFATLFLTSCLGTRHLSEGEYLLFKQSISGNKAIPKSELEQLYLQKPNKKILLFPFAPYVWIYQLGVNSFDSAKVEARIQRIENKFNAKRMRHEDNPGRIERLQLAEARKREKMERDLREGNMLMRWGEPLAVFNLDQAEATRLNLATFLQTRGFFRSNVELEVRYENQLAHVTYAVNEEQAFLVDTLRYQSSDSTLLRIIKGSSENSMIATGEPYIQEDLTAERERIEILLRNNGYFDFSRQYIVYEVDTNRVPGWVAITMIIRSPARRGFHRVFAVDSVNFVTDAGAADAALQRQIMSYNRITYQFFRKKFSQKVLDQRVFIVSDSLYSLNNTLATQRQLALLDNFKFININYDTTGGRFVANIFTSPLPKFQATNEVGLNVTQGFPGPFYNLTFVNRNVFNGLENLELGAFFGFEGVAAVTTNDVFRSLDAGAKLSLVFPQFLFVPFSQEHKRKLGRLNPNTIARLGYSYTNRPEYIRNSLNTSLIFNWQKERRRIYSLTLPEIGRINTPFKRADFDSLLQILEAEGNQLQRAFNPSFVSSINFFMMFNFNPDDIYGSRSSLLKLYGETGGTMFNLFTPTFLERNGLEYYKYLKGSADFRRHVSLGGVKGLATRLHLGLAVPYGENKALPYEKYFFAGGSTSIRAWQPRRLGPGSASPPLNPDPESQGLFDYRFERPGEILLEASAEFRSRLIGFVDWAFFVDAGNVWRLYQQALQVGADFQFDRFYKEIALGTGLGLRFNFSFLVIRFDWGVKIYDPARPEGERWLIDNISWQTPGGEPGQAVWNIAIGYPF